MSEPKGQGSTTRIASRDELRRLFHEKLTREIEELKDQNSTLQQQVASLGTQHSSKDWTLEYLDSPTEYIRYIPVYLLEKWEKEHRPVSTNELASVLKQRFGVTFSDNKATGIIAYLTKARRYNLDELIINVGREKSLWQINEKYISLIKEFRKEVINEQGKSDWTLEILERVRAPNVRAVPRVFLENWEQTGSLTMTHQELNRRVEIISGKKVSVNLILIWTRMQKELGRKSLLIQEERGKWRLNANYLDLVKQFCGDRN